MTTTAPLLFALIAISLVLPAAHAAKAPAQPDSIVMRVEFADAGHLRVHSVQAWDGANARDMRQSLDAYFGMADGALSQTEAEHIERATELDLENATLPFLSLAGAAPVVTSADVTLATAVGPVESIASFSVEHDIVAAVAPVGGDPVRLVVSAPWNGSLTFQPPAGMVALEGANVDGSGAATVELAPGREGVIVFGPAPLPPPPPPSPVEPEVLPPTAAAEEPVAQESVKTPGPSVALVIVCAMALAVLVGRRKVAGRR